MLLLPLPFGPMICRDAVAEGNMRFIGKGLEALQLYRFESQIFIIPQVLF